MAFLGNVYIIFICFSAYMANVNTHYQSLGYDKSFLTSHGSCLHDWNLRYYHLLYIVMSYLIPSLPLSKQTHGPIRYEYTRCTSIYQKLLELYLNKMGESVDKKAKSKAISPGNSFHMLYLIARRVKLFHRATTFICFI